MTFKSFVIGELYIFIILKEKIRGRANLENNFVYFLHDIEMGGQSYGEYLFIIDESGDVLTGGQPLMGIFST